MKSLSVVAIGLFLSFGAFAQGYGPGHGLECTPELGRGDEVIVVYVSSKNEISIHVNGGSDICRNGAVKAVAKGKLNLEEYGQAKATVACAKGKVVISKDYDETTLDITNLKLGLSDTTYMCN